MAGTGRAVTRERAARVGFVPCILRCRESNLELKRLRSATGTGLGRGYHEGTGGAESAEDARRMCGCGDCGWLGAGRRPGAPAVGGARAGGSSAVDGEEGGI